MTIKFEKPEQAFIAISRAVICSDNEITSSETMAMDAFKKLIIFQDYEQSENAVSENIFKAFNRKPEDTSAFSSEEINSLIDAVKKVVRPERSNALFAIAALLANINGLEERERILLNQLQKKLKIDNAFAEKTAQIISTAALSFKADTAIHFIRKILEISELVEFGKGISPTELSRVISFFGKVAGSLFGMENDEIVKFETPAEVFVAVMAAVIASDEKYSVDEMRLVWEEIEGMNIFKDCNYRELEKKIFNIFNKNTSQLTPFSSEEIEVIISAAKNMLSPQLREEVFKIAVKLAYADKTIEGLERDADEREKSLLHQFQKGLEIPVNVAQRIYGKQM